MSALTRSTKRDPFRASDVNLTGFARWNNFSNWLNWFLKDSPYWDMPLFHLILYAVWNSAHFSAPKVANEFGESKT